jgi:hypothetical protein
LRKGTVLGSEKGKAMGNELCCEQSFSNNKTQMALFLDIFLLTKLQVYVNNTGCYRREKTLRLPLQTSISPNFVQGYICCHF